MDEAQQEAEQQPPTPQFGITNDDFAAIEPGVDEAAYIGDQPTAAEYKEIVSDGRAPGTGWRRDDFPPNGPVRRTVWNPPWSLRPPTWEPEQWL